MKADMNFIKHKLANEKILDLIPMLVTNVARDCLRSVILEITPVPYIDTDKQKTDPSTSVTYMEFKNTNLIPVNTLYFGHEQVVPHSSHELDGILMFNKDKFMRNHVFITNKDNLSVNRIRTELINKINETRSICILVKMLTSENRWEEYYGLITT